MTHPAAPSSDLDRAGEQSASARDPQRHDIPPFSALDSALRFPSVPHLREGARRRLPRFVFDYLAGGLGRERALTRNERAFDAVELTPKYFVDISHVDCSRTLWGQRWSLPLGVSPVGYAGFIWPGGEIALATACRRAGIPFTQSSYSTETIDDIARAAGSSYWFQISPCRDLGFMLEVVQHVANAGARALLITVDTPQYSKRERDWRNRLAASFRPSASQALQALVCPAWSLAVARRGLPRPKALEAHLAPGLGGTNEALEAIFDVTDTWCDWRMFDELRRHWSGPLIVKGILDPETALAVVERGADGIVVSNHGGRQFDAAPATIEALPRIVEAVGDGAPVLIDGGIRSGLDVLRAVSRGAAFGLSGRTFYYAMGCLGEAGGRHAVAMLADEICREMKQLGWLTLPRGPIEC